MKKQKGPKRRCYTVVLMYPQWMWARDKPEFYVGDSYAPGPVHAANIVRKRVARKNEISEVSPEDLEVAAVFLGQLTPQMTHDIR